MEVNSSPKQNLGKFVKHNAKDIGIGFLNQIEESPEVHGLTWDAIYSGGGVAIGDINNDGFPDIFFSGNQVDDALYLNNGDFTFNDISKSSGISAHSGWSSGVAMADINADGYLDIYVCRNSWKLDADDPTFKRNKLFINNGDLSFTESAQEYGLDHMGYSTQATFLDYDKDGDLDMFLLNTPSNNLKQKVLYQQQGTYADWVSDQFFENRNGKFHNVSKAVGIDNFSFGLGVVAADIDHDTWIDLYVANDYERPDYLYINQRDGTFKNQLNEKIKHTSFTSMGCDAADINNDGLTDIGVVDMQSADHYRSKTNMPSMDEEQFWGYVKQGYNYQYMTNVLQMNGGYGFFSDIAQYAGLSSTDWSWSILMADFDLDRKKDIFISNGINRDLRNNDFAVSLEAKNSKKEKIDLFEMAQSLPSSPLPNFLFMNDGDYSFNESAVDLGIDEASFSFGAAYGDLDLDGDLDLVVNNNNSAPFILENDMAEGNYLKIKFKGPEGNPFAYGAKVFAFADDEILYQELSPVRGYQSSCEPLLTFGLGDLDFLDSLICFFPGEKSILLKNVKANKELNLDFANAQNVKRKVYHVSNRLFQEQSLALGLDFNHREDDYDDYVKEVLLPHSQTRMGPKVAIGDINGDDVNDVFVCGAAGQEGAFFIQETNGKFTKWNGVPVLAKDRSFEDVDALIADFDNDGDNDLLVQSGGGASADKWFDRLYINTGNDNWQRSELVPNSNYNGSCIAACDFDNDGDVDLFLGGRGEPLKYPYPGNSVIWENENGRFVDRTQEIGPELSQIGMVTDATWSDINADGSMDLILVGEWMQPIAFLQSEGQFVLDEHWFDKADESLGWWFNIESADINNDGIDDFIVGNIGENNKFHPSPKKPLRVYSSDFDENKSNDIVLAKEYKGKIVPTRGRECSSEQLPFIAKDFETFDEFANASVQNILGDKIEEALELKVNNFKSGVILSSPKGYHFQPFPAMAQLSPVMGSVVYDFDSDGHLDILIAGNLFDAEVETTRHDSGNGIFLKGNGSGDFKALGHFQSGFYAPLNVRGLHLSLNNAKNFGCVFVPANNNRLTAFTFKK